MPKMNVQEMPIGDIKPYERNPRKNAAAVDYVANSIKEFGFKQPIVVDTDHVIVVGHTRWLAAKKLKMKTVPVLVADDLTPEQAKAYRLADNKTNEFSEWDDDLLDLEMDDLSDIDMSLFGFELDEDEPATERKEAAYTESISVVIDCQDDEEAERIFNELTEEGYQCRISTL